MQWYRSQSAPTLCRNESHMLTSAYRNMVEGWHAASVDSAFLVGVGFSAYLKVCSGAALCSQRLHDAIPIRFVIFF